MEESKTADLSNPEKKNSPKITIICSIQDSASMNIKNHLLALREWKKLQVSKAAGFPENSEFSKNSEFSEDSDFPEDSEFSEVYESIDGKFRLVEIKEHHVFQDRIDQKLQALGFPASLIIFASKHRSKDEINSLTVHCTGNPSSENRLGGRPRELAVSSPPAMKSILTEMKRLSGEKGLKYDVTLEVTHHGPTELSVPSIYAEIGSTEVQWQDPVAGEVAAKAILAVSLKKVPVALGFGGGHYATRQTGLLLETGISFGHNFPKYRLESIDEALIKQAIEKSGADFVYFDRKSMKSADRKRVSEIVEKLGLSVLKESEIREQYGQK